MKRKIIALITAFPEAVHTQRVLHGIQTQCLKYDYDLAVFTTMMQINSTRVEYTNGEKNIYNLVNFDLIDGVIVDTSPLQGDLNNACLEAVCSRLHRECKKPVVALELPASDYPIIENQNDVIFRDMVRHIVEVHGKTKLCVLTGQKDNPAAESRLQIMLDEIYAHGLEIKPEHIIYGDFWYTSGDALARAFLDGSLEMPEAVLCASDHMALGLIDRLDQNGVHIPDDLLVIGMEATEEAATNRISLSSYEANDMRSAAAAVDYLRQRIEPDAPLDPFEPEAKMLFHPGMSCGCEPDYLRSARTMQSVMYHCAHNYALDDSVNAVDIGVLMESYAMEYLTGTNTPQDCVAGIQECSYLILPHKNFFLCLTGDWLNTSKTLVTGYPKTMHIAAQRSEVPSEQHADAEGGPEFETRLMIPELFVEREAPCIFYFAPVHFDEQTLGYAVLQRDMENSYPINLVFRNWLRFVNNALEMSRAKRRLLSLSVHDQMTGIYNRRGMYLHTDEMLDHAKPDDSVLACVVDMDGLKYINDTFGHNEGDFGILTVTAAVKAVTQAGEICVRAGGDEFYIIGVGAYEADAAQKRIDAFIAQMIASRETYDKPYTVTASIGCVVEPISAGKSLDDMIRQADAMMYEYKVARKRQRMN